MDNPLYVQEFGSGRPIVALHGLSGHGGRWRRFAANELAGYRVVAPDLRGHGRSVMTPPWRLEQYAEDVIALLDELGLDRVPVMGHSYGGAIAVYLARMAPQRVERLLLIDPALGLDPQEGLEDAEGARQDEFHEDLDGMRTSQKGRWPFATEQQIEDEITDHVVRTEDGRWRRNYLAAMAVTAWSEMSRPLVTPPAGIPTLLVPAAHADFVTAEHVEAFTRALGDDLTVHQIDCGHVIYLERPAELGKVITDWLAA